MGFKVEVLDKQGYPKKNVSVKVIYTDGQDNGSTDSNGIFDTGGSGGNVTSVQVSGSSVYSSGGRKVGYNDTLSVTA